MFFGSSDCYSEIPVWIHLKGSWNLALQTLGLGGYLAEQQNKMPIIWQPTLTNVFLREGYKLLAPDEFDEIYLPLTTK